VTLDEQLALEAAYSTMLEGQEGATPAGQEKAIKRYHSFTGDHGIQLLCKCSNVTTMLEGQDGATPVGD
jgi:hypothetical protein